MDIAYPIRPEAAAAPESGIVTLMEYGRGREGLIPLWVGEGDLPHARLHHGGGDALARSRGDLLYPSARPARSARGDLGLYGAALRSRAGRSNAIR